MKLDKNVLRYRRIVTKINKLEPKMEKLADADFPKKTNQFKEKIKSGQSLESILVEAYALVREAGRRVLGMRAYNVQLQGALAVNEGKIVEMKTGEGKTLTIVFAAYLNALDGNGVHVITSNDYLAERDAREMGGLYKFLGLSVDFITAETNLFDRQVAYMSDVTYLTNNEAGFDFLRDNMLYDARNKRQRGLNFAIIDEVDSVLIDEAQIPLVVSNNKDQDQSVTDLYLKLNPIIAKLKKGLDFTVDLKKQTVSLTPTGLSKIEKIIGVNNIYENTDVDYIYYVTRLLKAYVLFVRDRDYIVDNGQIVIVDEFTGRLMYNHRYFQGIHQALEAKEGLVIQSENTTLASITFQHFFKRYKKMAGLTGTAWTARKEFRLFFGKQVVRIPTNKPIRRIDKKDRFFVTWQDKLRYLTWATQEYYFKKGAVLVGTRSIKKSEEIGRYFLEANMPAQILNAQHTRREAEIISQAGREKTITVATNMAGRGTDIKLAESVKAKLGLSIFGTERHNARRIDNQLIGRAGRQGDPGQSQFLISADDILIKTYFRDEYLNVMWEIKKRKDVSRGVHDRRLQKISDRAQKKTEDLLFDQRVLGYEFDKVFDKQRKSFYKQRERVLLDDNLREETLGLIQKEIYRLLIAKYRFGSNTFTKSSVDNIVAEIGALVGSEKFNGILNRKVNIFFREGDLKPGEIKDVIYEALEEYYLYLENVLTSQKVRRTEKTVTLKVLDLLWVRHLAEMNQIQEASLVLSISQGGFFEDYELRASKAYQQMLLSVPGIVVRTFFRTINKLIISQGT